MLLCVRITPVTVSRTLIRARMPYTATAQADEVNEDLMDLTDLNVLCDDPRDQRPPRSSSAGTVAAKRPHPHLNQDSPTAAPGLAHASPSHGTAGSPGVASSPRLPAQLAKLAADMAALQALADDLSARVPPSAAAELHALGPLRQVRASTVGAAALPRLLVRGMGWGWGGVGWDGVGARWRSARRRSHGIGTTCCNAAC